MTEARVGNGTSRLRRVAASVVAVLALAACREVSDARAVAIVRAYNERVVEAYRTGDPTLVEGVAGPKEARKITGLIGVRADLGLTLDSRLVELRPEGVDRQEDEIRVRTFERWEYEDRRIGSGERVGQPSADEYTMEYVLMKVEGAWKVAEIRFVSEPRIGRKADPWRADPSVFHGIAPASPSPREGGSR